MKLLISRAIFWASAEAPGKPFLDNPTQYKPFFPFQWFGYLCFGSPSLFNISSSCTQYQYHIFQFYVYILYSCVSFTLSHLSVDLLKPVQNMMVSNEYDLPLLRLTSLPLMLSIAAKTCNFLILYAYAKCHAH